MWLKCIKYDTEEPLFKSIKTIKQKQSLKWDGSWSVVQFSWFSSVQSLDLFGGGGGMRDDSAETFFQSLLQEAQVTFWHRQGCPLFAVVHPAFSLPTTAGKVSDALKRGVVSLQGGLSLGVSLYYSALIQLYTIKVRFLPKSELTERCFQYNEQPYQI